jgi:hypothetical protein
MNVLVVVDYAEGRTDQLEPLIAALERAQEKTRFRAATGRRADEPATQPGARSVTTGAVPSSSNAAAPRRIGNHALPGNARVSGPGANRRKPVMTAVSGHADRSSSIEGSCGRMSCARTRHPRAAISVERNVDGRIGREAPEDAAVDRLWRLFRRDPGAPRGGGTGIGPRRHDRHRPAAPPVASLAGRTGPVVGLPRRDGRPRGVDGAVRRGVDRARRGRNVRHRRR